MKWMKLELIIQSEVSQKEKHQYSILMRYSYFFIKDMQTLNKHIEKALNIIIQQGNAKQNHSETPLHTQEDGCNQKDR